jgi:hypothetical protein
VREASASMPHAAPVPLADALLQRAGVLPAGLNLHTSRSILAAHGQETGTAEADQVLAGGGDASAGRLPMTYFTPIRYRRRFRM